MKMFVAIAATTMLASPVVADWTCQNPIEIACVGDACASSDAFTPMAISMTAAEGFTVCAYSDCHTAVAPTVLSGDGFVTVRSAAMLSLNYADGTPMAASLTISPDGDTGTLMAQGFVVPVLCTEINQ